MLTISLAFTVLCSLVLMDSRLAISVLVPHPEVIWEVGIKPLIYLAWGMSKQ